MPSGKAFGSWIQKYTDVPPGTVPAVRKPVFGTQDIEGGLYKPNIGPEIRFLTRNTAPFLYLTSQLRKEVVPDFVFRWVTDDYAPGWVQNTTPETTPGTSITLASGHGGRVRVNDILYVARTAERLRVTGVSGDTITITRNWGGVLGGAVALANGDILIHAGYAAPEGSTAPDPIRTTARVLSNVMQRFWRSWKATGTSLSVQLITGETGDWARQEAKMITELHMEMERAFLFGADADDSTGSGVISMAGCLDLLGYTGGTTANCPVLDQLNGFTISGLVDFAKEVSFYDNSPRVLLCSPEYVSFLYKGLASLTNTPYRWNADMGDDVFKLGWTTLDLGFLQFKVVSAPALKVDGTTPGSGNAANRRVRAIALSMDDLAYVHLEGRDGVRFETPLPNELQEDARKVSILYECSLKLWSPEKFGIIVA